VDQWETKVLPQPPCGIAVTGLRSIRYALALDD
jgi:hypothetical protein